MPDTLNGLYAITDSSLTPDDSLIEQVTLAILGGVRIVQLRDKTRCDTELLELATALQQLCTAHKTTFIMNDRLALAQQINADGLHIGQHDLGFQQVRVEFPNKILGMSCYGNLQDAQRYQDLGADYVAFGACFNSPTKPLARVIDPMLLTQAKQRLSIPICAIGGITLHHAPGLVARGVDMLAVISDLWCSGDVQQRAQAYADVFDGRQS